MVRRSQPRISVVALSPRGFVARFLLILLLAASLGLFLLSKSHYALLQQLRLGAADALVTVTSALAKPADAMHAVTGWTTEMLTLREENARLKQENLKLRHWQATAAELSNENAKLRELMQFAPLGQQSYISARVALDAQGPFARSVVIDAGEKDGVENDLAVVNADGLVGRVLETGGRTSRVLLLTDLNSRIPVMSETTRERAIAAGDNAGGLTLIYLAEKSEIKPGERIVTTSDGGVLPPGLPVGTVRKIEDGRILLAPFVDSHQLDYVSVVDFSAN